MVERTEHLQGRGELKDFSQSQEMIRQHGRRANIKN
jgi:hypothetical protein